MTTATLSNRTLEIDNMTGDACVKKVTTALHGIQGVSNPTVTVGEAKFKSDQTGCDAACAASGKAGYPAHEAGITGNGMQSDTFNRDGDNSRPDTGSRSTDANRGSDGKRTGDTGNAPLNAQKNAQESEGGNQTRMPTPNPAVAGSNKSSTGNDPQKNPTNPSAKPM